MNHLNIGPPYMSDSESDMDKDFTCECCGMVDPDIIEFENQKLCIECYNEVKNQ